MTIAHPVADTLRHAASDALAALQAGKFIVVRVNYGDQTTHLTAHRTARAAARMCGSLISGKRRNNDTKAVGIVVGSQVLSQTDAIALYRGSQMIVAA